MNVIVTAGGVTGPKQSLYEAAGGGPKSMIDIAGQPIVQWVLDALSASSIVEHVCVVGLPLQTGLTCAHPMVLLPDHGDMLSNIIAAAGRTEPVDYSHPGEYFDWMNTMIKQLALSPQIQELNT